MDVVAIGAIAEKIAEHVERLCGVSGADRHPGSAGNREATDYVACVLAEMGFRVERHGFDCVDWEPGSVVLSAGGTGFEAHPGPYSPSYEGETILTAASTLEELAGIDASGKVLLLYGRLAKEQLTPKNYPFYRFDEHARIVEELERQNPAAIVAATGKNPGTSGALYPFPLIEDADFGIPTAYMKDVDGERLLGRIGERVRLKIESRRVSARAEQLLATRRGRAERRVVLSAHLDAKKGTPGALDNAAGLSCILAVAELLRDHELGYSLEVVPFNGEDNYAAPGEMAYIAAHEERFGDVELAINVDAAGFLEGHSAVSLYECPERVERAVRQTILGSPRVVEGEQWPQSDHMVFVMRGVPALAVTSEQFEHIASEFTHTDRDVPAVVDPVLLGYTAQFLADVVMRIDEQLD